MKPLPFPLTPPNPPNSPTFGGVKNEGFESISYPSKSPQTSSPSLLKKYIKRLIKPPTPSPLLPSPPPSKQASKDWTWDSHLSSLYGEMNCHCSIGKRQVKTTNISPCLNRSPGVKRK